MPVVERLLFAVFGIAIIAGLIASYAYERSVADRRQVSAAVTMMMAQSPHRTAADEEGCRAMISTTHLMSPVPATRWLGSGQEPPCTSGVQAVGGSGNRIGGRGVSPPGVP